MPAPHPDHDVLLHTPGRWIGWPGDGRPEDRPNRFAWFRREFNLREIPSVPVLRFAADSTARLWVNGACVRRQVTRFRRSRATCEAVDVGRQLRAGANVVVALVHNWGEIGTFQRQTGGPAGFWVDAPWLVSDSRWGVLPAEAFRPHDIQILGAGDLTRRIRFPQIVEAERLPGPEIHQPGFEDPGAGWTLALVHPQPPWPATPRTVETRGRRDETVRPAAVVAAGQARRALPVEDDPALIGPGLRSSACVPSPEAALAAQALVEGRPLTIAGEAGESRYLTVDFHRPVHGYPLLDVAECSTQVRADVGYGELWRSPYDGRTLVESFGWIDTGAVVGSRYADRIILNGPAAVELPDERTCRWLTLHLHFDLPGSVTIRELALVSSQHPFDVEGSCDLGDARLDAAVRLGLDHARVSMTDALVDTPGREDGQWIEDAPPRAELAARWGGDTSLRRLFLRLGAESQDPEGRFHLFPPSGYRLKPPVLGRWDWQMQWGQALWDEWRWTGDRDRVARYFPELQRSVSALLQPLDEDGLWRTSQVFADIRNTPLVTEGGVSGVATPLLIARLPRFAELARAAGEERWAERWETTARRMADAFRRHLIVPAEGGRPPLIADVLDPDLRPFPGFSQAAHTEALAEGLIEPDLAAAMLDYVFPDPDGDPPEGVRRWNTPTYFERALRALSRNGRGDRALRHLLARFAPYLPGDPANVTPEDVQGPHGGPLPEYWISREDLGLAPGEENPRQPFDASGSHGWGAVPLLWLHEHALGVRIAAPGGDELAIEPDLCGRPRLAGVTCTPKGQVRISAEAKARLEVTLPTAVAATVRPPSPLGRPDREAETVGPDRYRITGPGTWIWASGSSIHNPQS